MTEPPRNFQHYELLRRDDGTPWELGRGAMGITYKAFDVNLCCEVALKVVSSALVEHPEARERFVREARAAAALRHRNVASVYHLGIDDEHFFYAMEFINGETLDALVRRGGPLSVENALRVILQVSRALAAAERQHLVHRDIKPANLMVTHEDADEEIVVKVIDFGLARPSASSEDSPPLTIGGFVGTPQYASPEQLEERPLDARSDFYSLGVTAWFLLTGRVPFTGSLATVCQQQLTQPPPWEQLSPSVPTCVRGLLGHLLAKDATRRPQNAGELRAEIETCLKKVEGTEPKRDWHLPVPPAVREEPRDRQPEIAGRAPQIGATLAGRYRLLRDIGGNRGVRVYQARDESADKLVVLNILPAGLVAGSAGRSQLAEEVRLIQAATHPNLIKILALESAASPPLVFLVEEWLAGFSLRELLAGRGGSLPIVEVLRLLAQAAAATDHAARCRLGPLPSGLPETHVCFPALAASLDDGPEARQWLPKPIAEWPEWTLKIHALRVQADLLALDTWAGGDTLLPAAGHGGEEVKDAGQSVQALARMVYELLGGTPMGQPSRMDAPVRPASLPALNEEGNRVLRQVLTGESVIVHGWELHEALARAVGEGPARSHSHVPPTAVVEAPIPVAVETERRDSAATSNGPIRQPNSTLTLHDPSVAPFLQDGHLDDPGEPTAGSAWERLTLVTGQRTHPGRWVAGIVGLAAVFVLVFVGVFFSLLRQTPAHAALAATPAKKRPPEAATGVAVSRRSTPSPLPPNPRGSALPTVAAAPAVASTPVSSPAVLARAEDLPPAPSPAGTPPGTPVRETFTMVRLESIPPGAQIRLGDEILGTTPCRVRLPAGDHQLIARYQNWPETRHSIHLDGTEARATVEIRLMRPELIPGLGGLPAGVPDSRNRRIPVPAARRVLRPETPVASAPVPTPTPDPSEPPVRPALRVLTPFKIDDPVDPPPSTPANPQPFSTDQPDDQ